MNWDALWSDGPVIAGHAVAALTALLRGAVQFARPKGTMSHRGLGYLWVTLMGGVALSSFGIRTIGLIGPFSAIHLLSVFVLVNLVLGLRAARQGRIAAHRSTMVQMYLFGLILAGAFTLLPGRTMHGVVFGLP